MTFNYLVPGGYCTDQRTLKYCTSCLQGACVCSVDLRIKNDYFSVGYLPIGFIIE